MRSQHTITLNWPLRIIAAVLSLLAVLGIVGDLVVGARVGVIQILLWGATLLGCWLLARAAWRGELVLGPKSR